VIEEIGQSEVGERDGDHVLLTLARVVRDVNQRPIPTLQAATTVPVSERTAIPAAGKTVNGTEVTVESAVSEESAETVENVAETVVIAADAISMTDLDETYSTNDPDVVAAMIAEETVVNKIVVVTDGVEVAVLEATAVHGAALHHHAGKSLLQT
jgi:hypothetical protein